MPGKRNLPQILLVGDKLIDHTSFEVKRKEHTVSHGMTRVDGFVSGTINGKVNGYVNGLVDGEVNVTLVSGNAQTEAGGQPPEELQPPAETEPAEQEGGDHHE